MPAFHDRRQKDWTTTLAVRYGEGETRSAFKNNQRKSSLLNLYEPIDLLTLGHGIEDITSKTETNNFWGTGKPFAPGATRLEENDGRVGLLGKIKARELGVTIKQGIFSGFYAKAHVPIREVKIDEISTKNLGQADVNGVIIDDFVKNDLPKILRENGFEKFESFEKEHFKETLVSEFLIAAGWQGRGWGSFGPIDWVQGFVQAGVTVPVGGKKNEDKLSEIPLGYNDFWGFNGQVAVELGLWDILIFGVHAGATIFLNAERTIRMRTNKEQDGWIVLDKGRAKIENGTIWNVTGYLRGDRIIQGLSLVAGYSYTKQERTTLNLNDDKFLQTFVDAEFAKNPPRFASKDEIINTDKRYRNWDHHTVHLMAEYDTSVHIKSYAPFVRVEYSYPILGRRTLTTDMVAGTAGISVVWGF